MLSSRKAFFILCVLLFYAAVYNAHLAADQDSDGNGGEAIANGTRVQQTVYAHKARENVCTGQEVEQLPCKRADHSLCRLADRLEEVDIEFRQILTSDKIREIVNAIPDDWLNWTEGTETPQDLRDIYIRFLEERMKHSETFVNEAQNARKALI